MKKLLLLLALVVTLSACTNPSNPTADNYSKETATKEESSGEKSSEAAETSKDNASTETGQIHKITGQEAKELATSQTVTIVDVRTKEEYESGHVENAILLPLQSIGSEAPAELPDKDAIIILYCRSGNRSGQAAQKLLDLGYKNIYDFGPATAWPDGLVK